MSLSKQQNKELQEALADQKYWQEEVGNPLGLKLVGWTGRNSAQFRGDNGEYVTIDGWFAKRLIANERKVLTATL